MVSGWMGLLPSGFFRLIGPELRLGGDGLPGVWVRLTGEHLSKDLIPPQLFRRLTLLRLPGPSGLCLAVPFLRTHFPACRRLCAAFRSSRLLGPAVASIFALSGRPAAFRLVFGAAFLRRAFLILGLGRFQAESLGIFRADILGDLHFRILLFDFFAVRALFHV